MNVPFPVSLLFFLVSKEKFEDTKRVTRSRKSQKDRQYNGTLTTYKEKGQTIQWAKRKRTDNTMGKRRRTDNTMGKKKKDKQ